MANIFLIKSYLWMPSEARKMLTTGVNNIVIFYFSTVKNKTQTSVPAALRIVLLNYTDFYFPDALQSHGN